MSSRKKKTQISVYIDPDIMTMLADYAARREQSQSMIAEAAIASFLSPDDAERREAAIAIRNEAARQRDDEQAPAPQHMEGPAGPLPCCIEHIETTKPRRRGEQEEAPSKNAHHW